MHFSADPDARWVTKGSKSTLGYKGFARIDEEGFVDKVHTTPANRAESPEFATMIDGASAPDTSDGPKPMPKWRWRPSDKTSSRPRTRSHSTRKTGLRPSRAEFIHRINSVTPFTPGNRINQANTLIAPLKRQQGESGRQIRAEAENQLVTQRSFIYKKQSFETVFASSNQFGARSYEWCTYGSGRRVGPARCGP
ncbi:hypothetical protein ABIE58_000240 [Roseovarius sp. MBR-78]|uniref:hypothetical protein n=1 Tax=Roseovarius sp. MBR-78 TaxID=3156460 RepID=UPI00339790D0